MTLRIAVTGLGAISSLGPSAEMGFGALRNGQVGIRPVTIEAGRHGPEPINVPLANITAADRLFVEQSCRNTLAHLMDSYAKLAHVSTSEAIADAGLPRTTLDARTALVFGHGTGGMESLEGAYSRFFGQKTTKVHPLTIPRVMLSSPASVVAMLNSIRGPVFATSSACASSGHAIIQGALLIRAGAADAAIVGGSESIATASMLSGWEAMRAMASDACRPFCRSRDGMVVGEGGAALVLERFDKAVQRGARIYAEVVGHGATSDAFHITQPGFEGAAEAIRQAVADRLGPDTRLVVSAHGTGTPLNDSNEAAALKAVLDPARIDYRVIATKSYHGHLLGASSALQIVLGLKAALAGHLPPIANFRDLDPDCALPLVIGSAEPYPATHLLSNAFAFGGLNASLLFKLVG